MRAALIRREESLALTEYHPQGLGHILKLGGIVTAGMVLVSIGGSLVFAAPLAAATVYQLFKSAGKAKDPDWCESRDEIWHYKFSLKHRSIADDYESWCEEWGRTTINAMIEPMVGNCEIANFVKDQKHPYYGLRGVLIYDHAENDLPPLTPHDYILRRLAERKEVLQRREQEPEAIDVKAQTIPLQSLPDLSNPVSPISPATNPQSALKFLLSLTNAPLQPVIIAGLPGSGKGILAALALSLGARDNKARFWIFNPKSKLEEAGYWMWAERHYLKNRLQHDEKLFSDLMKVLEEFGTEGTRRNDAPGNYPPFILLLEEINALTGLLTPKQRQVFKAKIIALASLLRGCNMALWLSGQSITLEDLGLTGRSNRAMFTAIACIGSDREASAAICQPLGIPFDNSSLEPNKRYWLTSSNSFVALEAPKTVKQFSSWDAVRNVIDLRPTSEAEPEVETTKEVESLLINSQAEGVICEAKIPQPILEDSYRIKASDEFTSSAETTVSSCDRSTVDTLNEPLNDVARYILSKGGELPVSSLKNWGKTRRKGSLDSGEIEQSLLALAQLHLIETFIPMGTKGEWIRWIAT
jgi:hypothetical protein